MVRCRQKKYRNKEDRGITQCAVALHGARLAHSALTGTVGHCFPSRSPDTRLSLSFVATCKRFGLSYGSVPNRAVSYRTSVV